MNMLRRDLKTVLFIFSPLEDLRPVPITSPPDHPILRTDKAEPVTFCCQIFALPAGGHLLERVMGGGFRHFLGPILQIFVRSGVAFFTFLIQSRSHFPEPVFKFLSTQ